MVILTFETVLFSALLGILFCAGILSLIILVRMVGLIFGFKLPFKILSTRFLSVLLLSVVVVPVIFVFVIMHRFESKKRTLMQSLDTCTSLTIKGHPDILEAIKYTHSGYSVPLCNEMAESITSRDSLKINDEFVIKKIKYLLSLSKYNTRFPASYYIIPCAVEVEVYEGPTKKVSFWLLKPDMIVIHGWAYRLSNPRIIKELFFMSPETNFIASYFDCRNNLEGLYALFGFFRDRNNSYPNPKKWCDDLIDNWNELVISGEILKNISLEVNIKEFVCRGAGLGGCSYGMNPDCEPDSPPDTVLLFESVVGWNQHGGPELMVFDHHEPKGANVLLNNGTVVFVTPEEVNNLKW